MGHHCHATGCTTQIPPEMFMCKKHWFMLPKLMKKRVWATYRPGQCDDWDISHEYAIAAMDAVKYIANKEKVIPDISIYTTLDPGSPEVN